MANEQTQETIPFWLAVGITAILFLPLTIFLGRFNLPLWVSFIVWAEFFVFGAKVQSAWKFILLGFPSGAVICTLGFMASFMLAGWIPALAGPSGSAMWGMWIGFGIAVCVLVYIMKYVKLYAEGSLAYFNGMTMLIAVFFTGSFPDAAVKEIGVTTHLAVACLWTILAGAFGLFLGWFNVAITFPHKVAAKPAH
jgi:Protein of unknown function (DUF1097)